MLHDGTPVFLLSYEKHLLSENKSLTRVGIYMKNLREGMNDAIAAKVISRNNYPFTNYQIPTGKNAKKAWKIGSSIPKVDGSEFAETQSRAFTQYLRKIAQYDCNQP